MTLQMTADHAQSLHEVTSLLTSGGFQPNDPAHQKFLTLTAESRGLTQDRYPALHAAIAAGTTAVAATSPTGSFGPDQKVLFVATDRATNKIMARALLSRPPSQPVAMMQLTLFVAQPQGNHQTVVLAQGQVHQFVGQTLTVSTDLGTALSCAPNTLVVVIMSWVINYQDGTTETNSIHAPVRVASSTDPTVTAPIVKPTRTIGDLDHVLIGLGRGGSVIHEDVDYWFWQTQVTNPIMLVPLAGSLTTKARMPLGVGVNNPALELTLALQEGGVATIELTHDVASRYMQYFVADPTDPSGRTVSFQMLASNDSAGTAINFGTAPWVSDTVCFFTAKMTFLDEDYNVEQFVITSSAEGDDNPMDGVAHIKPLKYVWHCFAAGTQILLADGTTRAVEQIDNTHTVTCGDGTHRKVQATLAQPHHGPVTHLTFASGASLTVSGTHPVITPSGAVQASSLKVGDAVLLDGGGRTTVKAVEERKFSGEVLFNLWLDSTRPGDTHLVANGIVVGDYLVQGRVLHESKTHPEKVRARLPKSLHRDYASWLEDRAAVGK